MKDIHFKIQSKDGSEYKITNKPSYLVVSDSFIKMDFWLKSEIPVGCLTEEGIRFVEQYFTDEPMLCVAPIKRLRPIE
jgi:hypothetical protein